jgi:cytidylate kinase
MPCQVVCISRSDAAGGEQVGRLAADRLGVPYVDEEIVSAAARSADIDPELIASVEQRKPLIRRVLEQLSESGAAESLALGGYVPVAVDLGEPPPASDDLRALIREAIEARAARGKVVIGSHAASFALAGRDDVLRVLVTASPDTRARRLADAGLDEREASRKISSADTARADYLKRFYGVRTELPTHYDLVVNTDVLSPEQAAALVAQAATSE